MMIITIRNIDPALISSESIIRTPPILLQWDANTGSITAFFGFTSTYGQRFGSLDKLTEAFGWAQAMVTKDASTLGPMVMGLDRVTAAATYREEPEYLSLRPIALLFGDD